MLYNLKRGGDKMFQSLEKVLMPVADILGKNKILCAIRDGFLVTTPLLIVGSIFLLIANFPVPGWTDFWTNMLGDHWDMWFTNVSRATFNMIALLTCAGTAYSYTKELKGDAIFGAVVALVSFWILMPTRIYVETLDGMKTISALAFSYIGTDGIFLALVTSILSVSLFMWVYKKGWTIKMPAGVPPMVCDSFAALIPSAIVMLFFFICRIGFELTPFESAHQFIFEVLQTPLKGIGNTIAAQCVNTVLISVFWFFGINGPAVTNTVFAPIMKIVTLENLEAFQNGLPLKHILTDPFSNFFVQFGGGGSTLSLVIVMLTCCKSDRMKQLGKLSIVPGFFGINEPIIFGLPIVLNPVVLVPFILVPLINILLSYFATLVGIIPYTTGISIPWTTPIFFSGFLSTGSWFAGFFQLGLLLLGCLIYYPFIKILDKKYLEEQQMLESSGGSQDIDFNDLKFDD